MGNDMYRIICDIGHRSSGTTAENESVEEFIKNNTCPINNCGEPIFQDTLSEQ